MVRGLLVILQEKMVNDMFNNKAKGLVVSEARVGDGGRITGYITLQS